MSTNQEIRLQQQLDEAYLKFATLKQEHLSLQQSYTAVWESQDKLAIELQELREQKPYAYELPSIPPRIVLHPDFNANYGGTVKPLYADPVPASEGYVLVPINNTNKIE